MSMPSGHNLGDLIKWTARDEWRERVDAVMAEHFGPAMDAFDLSFEEICETIGDGWSGTLWGCAFEDFLTRRFEVDDETAVEAYLRRRGWKERVATRAYMSALQHAVMSLYEVSDIVPGRSFRARDLIRGGDPVLIIEQTATQTLRLWDRIAARVILDGDRHVIAGGVLAYSVEGSERLFGALREQTARPPRRSHARKQDEGLGGWAGSDQELRKAAPLFTIAWLEDVLPRALDPSPPPMFNSDGDAVVFHSVRFPLVPKATARSVRDRLAALSDLRQETATFWNWVALPPAKRPAVAIEQAVFWNVTLDDGSVVLGTVELKQDAVVLDISSAARAERGRRMLAQALEGLVVTPLTEIRTVAQMLKADQRSGPRPTELPIPPDEHVSLIHDLLDRQYRALLDEPVPMLGNRTPRAASRSAGGRRDLVTWLKQLENHTRHVPDPDDPMATYDFSWLWQELKVEHLRK